jgi:aryl-alcohol dehydrogenase-like predicted oxidoreductase
MPRRSKRLPPSPPIVTGALALRMFARASVITGATSLEHVLHNVTAASWTLTPADVDEVTALLPAQRLPA